MIVFPFLQKVESELVQMELDEREFFLEELGVKEVGLPALVRK
jgi:hypothetical protein